MMQKLIKETMTGKKQKGMRIDSGNFMQLEKCLKEKKWHLEIICLLATSTRKNTTVLSIFR